MTTNSGSPFVEALHDPDQTVRANLELGAIYEETNLLNEAENAYARAFLSSNHEIRSRAREGLKRVIARRGAAASLLSRTYELASSSFATAIKAVITLILLVAVLPPLYLFVLRWLNPKLFAWLTSWLGRNRLDVVVADATQEKLGEGFGDVLSMTLDRMNDYLRYDGLIAGGIPAGGGQGQRIPSLVPTRDTRLAELIESGIPGIVGRTVGYLTNIHYSEFVVRSRIRGIAANVNIMVWLKRREVILRSWDRVTDIRGYLEAERDVAFEIVSHLHEETLNAPRN